MMMGMLAVAVLYFSVRDAIPQQKMRLVDDTYQTGSRGERKNKKRNFLRF